MGSVMGVSCSGDWGSKEEASYAAAMRGLVEEEEGDGGKGHGMMLGL